MIRFPVTIGHRDVVVGVADPTFTLGEAAVPVDGAGSAQAALFVGDRPCGADRPFLDAGVRPGDTIGEVAAHGDASLGSGPAPTAWALHVIAGIDAGRVVAVPAVDNDAEPGVSAFAATVGRSTSMHLRLSSSAVSSHHCTVSIRDGLLSVTDQGSRNGTIVGGYRIGSQPVEIEFGEPIRCGPAVVVVRAVATPDTPNKVAALLDAAPSGPVPYYRSPVDLPPAPGPDIELPAVPRRPRTGRPGLIAFLLPMAMAGAMVWFTKQWLFAIFALMGPVMMLVTTADRAGRNRRVRKRSRRRYRRELVEFADDLEQARALELVRLRDISPDLAEVCRRGLTAASTLWSRRRDHPNYLTLALGLGDIAWDAPMAEAPDEVPDLVGLVDAGRILHNAPVTCVATPGTTIGLSGDRRAALASARGLVTQAAVMHGPAELRIVVVTSAASASEWDWAKWLPHLRPTYAGGRLLVAVAVDGVVDAAMVDGVLADTGAGADILAVVDLAGLGDNGDAALRRLLRRSEAPVTGIVVSSTEDGLPDLCDVVVDHHDSGGEATCRWPRDAGRTTDVVVGGLGPGTAELVARALARLADPDAGGGSAALPMRVRHAEVLELEGARPADVVERWCGPSSTSSFSSSSSSVTVGLGESGPVVVDLAVEGPHCAVVGGRGTGKTEHLASMVFSLAATYRPDRLHMVLWGESFGHLARLPHVASALSRIDESTLAQFSDGLDRELSRRERLRSQAGTDRLEDSSAGDPVRDGGIASEPALIVVIDDVDTISRILPAAVEGMIRLLRRARGLGVHVLWSTGRPSGGSLNELVDLSPMRVVLRLASGPDSVDLLGTDVASRLERSLPGRAYVVSGRGEPREVQGGAVSVGAPRADERFVLTPFDLVTGRSGFLSSPLGPPDERFLVTLLGAAGATSARPPDLLSTKVDAVSTLRSPGLLELLGIDGRAGLVEVTDAWSTADDDSFLRIPIGVDPEMRPVSLDLKESALGGMGPHGLLVGATGAGKSELLRTLVSGLALTHSPETLALVLVDFKGGASFSQLGRLPHVAGVVTNLADDLALVDRILAALGGEQRRRQELLAAAGNLGNVREYRAARRAGTLPPELGAPPLPTLLVIVDEFAELLDQEPAFIDFFLTIGRVGRSLGIHLLLASQRLEEGKLRGLDTYLSYRLGLRTFSAAESRIVLGVPDAFSLPNAPGGGYLKVGSSAFDRFQASYVSGAFESGADPGGGHVAAGGGDAVDGAGTSPPTTVTPTTVIDAVLDRLVGAAERVHQIWLPPLAPAIPLSPLFGQAGFVHDPDRGFAAADWPGTAGFAVPVGVVDEPARQQQLPLILDFTGAQGNLALAGAPQSGKSLFLRTLALSLAVTHTPDEVQVYGIDFGGGALDAIAGLPHVGMIATRLQPELVGRVLGHVEDLLNRREALFADLGIDSVATFRRRRVAGELPPDAGGDVFLFIDGWAAFREKYEAYEPVIADLASRGLGHGIHVIITMNRWMEMRANVLDVIGGRLELRLNSPLDSAFDRRRAAVIRSDQPGRGLHPSTLLFQVALPRLDDDPSDDNLQAATIAAVDHIAARWSGSPAPEVVVLPTELPVSALMANSDAGATAEVGAAAEGGAQGRSGADAGSAADPAAVGGESGSAAAAADGSRPGVPVGLIERGMATWYFDLRRGEPHFVVYGDGESGKTTFLSTWLTGLTRSHTRDEARVVVVDYRRTLLEVVPESHLAAYAASEPATRDVIDSVVATVTERLPGADVTAAELRNRSWWSGPELYVVVDDYDLVVTPSGNPIAALLPLLAQGRDIGLHLVLAHRVAGAAKMMYEPISLRLREVSATGLILSGSREEGPLLGAVRASPQPPGRGTLVTRSAPPSLVQVAIDDLTA